MSHASCSYLASPFIEARNPPLALKKRLFMKPSYRQDNSQPFLLRVWKEESEGGFVTWCGKLQHIVNGGAYLFRDWATLTSLLEANLQEGAGSEQAEAADIEDSK